MPKRSRALSPQMAICTLVATLGALAPREASAHVKWFCAYDVAGQPRGLEMVLCTDFELLTATALAVLLFGIVLEGTTVGAALLRAFDRVTGALRSNTELLFRAVVGAFFVSLWAVGGIILTPELKTTSQSISWLQLAIASGMLWRHTMPLSAAGIVFLFGTGVREYGVFHLMDYPVFLGVAAYLAATGLGRSPFGVRPLDIVRWTAAVTLMWASVEKWAYPHWTFPLIEANPAMTAGFDREFYMQAAGVIEFTLAFALVLTPLVRRTAAIMLAGAFIGAVFEFGKVDAIGHAPVIFAMLAIAADNAVARPRQWRPVLATVGFGAALAGFLAVYYVAHAALFGASYT